MLEVLRSLFLLELLSYLGVNFAKLVLSTFETYLSVKNFETTS